MYFASTPRRTFQLTPLRLHSVVWPTPWLDECKILSHIWKSKLGNDCITFYRVFCSCQKLEPKLLFKLCQEQKWLTEEVSVCLQWDAPDGSTVGNGHSRHPKGVEHICTEQANAMQKIWDQSKLLEIQVEYHKARESYPLLCL